MIEYGQLVIHDNNEHKEDEMNMNNETEYQKTLSDLYRTLVTETKRSLSSTPKNKEHIETEIDTYLIPVLKYGRQRNAGALRDVETWVTPSCSRIQRKTAEYVRELLFHLTGE